MICEKLIEQTTILEDKLTDFFLFFYYLVFWLIGHLWWAIMVWKYDLQATFLLIICSSYMNDNCIH